MKTFKKYFPLPASPEEVYLALTKELSIRLWTGAEAEFKDEEGTEFSLWNGDISGRNIELEYGKKIVQQWYFGDENPPSIVTIKLHPDKSATSMEFTQTNIPDADFNDFTEGLNGFYFAGVRDFFS